MREAGVRTFSLLGATTALASRIFSCLFHGSFWNGRFTLSAPKASAVDGGPKFRRALFLTFKSPSPGLDLFLDAENSLLPRGIAGMDWVLFKTLPC